MADVKSFEELNPETGEKEFERVMGRLWSSPDGKFVLDELKRRTSLKLFDSDPLKMAYKVGMLDLLRNFESYVRTQ